MNIRGKIVDLSLCFDALPVVSPIFCMLIVCYAKTDTVLDALPLAFLIWSVVITVCSGFVCQECKCLRSPHSFYMVECFSGEPDWICHSCAMVDRLTGRNRYTLAGR